MSELKELGTFLEPVLAIPFRGKVYNVQAVDAETGLRLQKMLATGIKAAQEQDVSPEEIQLVSDAEELGFYESLLGDTYTELTEAKVPYQALKMIGSAVMLWTVQDFEKAAEFWRAEGKSAAPNRCAPNGDPDPYGRGEYNPETGLSDYYEYPEGTGKGRPWKDILIHWSLIEADLQDAGIDTGSGILRQRSWAWLAVRIAGLLNKPPAITPDGRVMPSTRLGMQLNPPEAPRKK